jgi:tetratricopeptide (TPR) repeat protein
MTTPAFSYDVFLSHNQAQKDWTRQLARLLREDGFKVWFDEWVLPGQAGGNWIDSLAQGVEESRKVALIWSPEFFTKPWPEFESSVIQQMDPVGRQQRIIPLLHTPCNIPTKWRFRQALKFAGCDPGSEEFAFHYHHLVYNLDNTRPFEGDFEVFRKQRQNSGTWSVPSEAIPPVRPLPRGSRVFRAASGNFVGRVNELRELAAHLTPGNAALVGVHAAVTGMGGVGKTQLAIEYAHRYGHLYSGGVFWLNMESADNAVNEIARCGGPEGMDIPGFSALSVPEQATRIQKHWQEDAAPRLLIFDNAEDSALVQHWRPKTGHCSLLITSRRDYWPAAMGVQSLAVKTLPRAHSLTLISRSRPGLLDRFSDSQAADQLCDYLGDLPLALEVAAAYLEKYPTERIADYLNDLKQTPIEDPSLKDVWACFALSYRKLQPADPVDALALHLFHLAGQFAQDSISRTLLMKAAGLDDAKRVDERRFNEAAARLHELALLAKEPDDRLLLHRLVRQFVRAQKMADLPPEQAAARIAEILLDFADREIESGLPREFARERVHLRAAAEQAEHTDAKLAGRLYNALGRHGRMLALWQEAKTDHERALKIDEAVYGSDHPAVAADVNNLGLVLRDLGDLPGARQCFERALRIDEAVYGLDHPAVATAVNNLGLVLRNLGDLPGARQCFERALKIAEASLGTDHPKVGIHINNLGLVLQDLGDLPGARRCFERALKIDEASLGTDHPKVGIRINNLGLVLQDLGDLPGARQYIERALKIDEAVYGLDHPEVATDVNNLGLVLQDLGDLPGARRCFERALRIDEAVYGSDHPAVATNVNNLGLVLQGLGDLPGARQYIKRALKIARAVYGPDHPTVLLFASNLNKVIQAMSNSTSEK